MSTKQLIYHSDKTIEEIVNCLDLITEIQNKEYIDSDKGFRIFKKGKKYEVYYKYCKSLPRYDRFGFNSDDPFFNHNYFVLEPFSASIEKTSISFKIIHNQKMWNIIKLFVFAPLISLFVFSGALFVFETCEIEISNYIFVYLTAIAITYLGTILNVLFNNENEKEFEENAVPMLKRIVENIL